MRLRSLAFAAVLIGVATTLAGCGDRAVADAANELRGRTFLSTSVTEDGRSRPLVGDTVVRLEFPIPGKLRFDAGCNGGQASVDLGDGRINLLDTPIGTQMGCGSLAEQGRWIVELIYAEPSWQLSGNELVLTAGRTRVDLLDIEVADPDRPLAGTTWVLDAIIDPAEGDAWGSSGMSRAWLRLSDGRVDVYGGCNELGGDAEVRTAGSGYTITVGAIGIAKAECGPDTMLIENQLLKVVRGDPTATIEADRLRLETGDGRAVELLAEHGGK